MQSKTGRNDPCPCGSGKKYKKCHELLKGPKKFTAQVISSSKDNLQAGSSDQKLTSFFKKSVQPQQIVSHEPPPEEKTYDM